MLLGNDGALEHLDTLTVAFLDLQVDTDGVTHVHRGGFLGGHVLLNKALHEIHSLFPPNYTGVREACLCRLSRRRSQRTTLFYP